MVNPKKGKKREKNMEWMKQIENIRSVIAFLPRNKGKFMAVYALSTA